MEKRKPNSVEALTTAIGFVEEDLFANRGGELTPRQCVKLSESRSQWSVGLFISVMAIPVGSLFAILDGRQIHDTLNSRLGIICLITLVAGVIALVCWQNKSRYDTDIRNGEVAITEGRIRLNIIDDGRNGARYFVDVMGIHLKVSKKAFLAFKNGDPYAIYYAPHSQTLVAAEWLME